MAQSTPPTDDYLCIAEHYERCLHAHGATPRGVDWPDADDLKTRFGVMLAAMPPSLNQPCLLDIGCGPGLLLDYLSERQRLDCYDYLGIDISALMVNEAHRRWPQYAFQQRDILREPLPPESADLVIMNGVLTEKVSLSQQAMLDFAQAIIKSSFRLTRHVLAFNVMSVHVDWQRDELFYWPFDELARFLKSEVSRHFLFRADYGLYEYTVYVYRNPVAP